MPQASTDYKDSRHPIDYPQVATTNANVNNQQQQKPAALQSNANGQRSTNANATPEHQKVLTTIDSYRNDLLILSVDQEPESNDADLGGQ